MSRVVLGLILLALAACDMRGLERRQLFGPPADAGADASEFEAGVAPDARLADTVPMPVIFVTGQVRSTCGESFDAKVGLAGRHVCSYAGKGSFGFRIDDVPAGTTLTITAEKLGYLPFSAPLTLKADGTTFDIVMMPASGTCTPRPATEPCVCDGPGCVMF